MLRMDPLAVTEVDQSVKLDLVQQALQVQQEADQGVLEVELGLTKTFLKKRGRPLKKQMREMMMESA